MKNSQDYEYTQAMKSAYDFRKHFKELEPKKQKKLVQEICEAEGKGWLAERFLRFVLSNKR